MLDERPGSQSPLLFIPNVFCWVEARTICRPVKFINTKLSRLMTPFMDLALCTGAHSCRNRKGPSPNCSHKVVSMELSSISRYAEAFRVRLTGTKGPSSIPEKQPYTIIPPAPNFTLGTMQFSRWRSVICQSRERVSTVLESSGGVLYTTASNACIALADVLLGCSCSAMETHSMKLSMHCS